MAKRSQASATALRWLHLTDLHLGCRGVATWHVVEEAFKKSLAEWIPKIGAPHLIFVTGDLTFKGVAEEFDRFDGFVGRLRDWIAAAANADAAAPLLVPVPGNHDLVRPAGRERRAYRILNDLANGRDDEDVAFLFDELWMSKVPGSDLLPAKPFRTYQEWFERTALAEWRQRRGVSPTLGRLPGDFCLDVEWDGLPKVRIVGLNSAWAQYEGGDFEGKLHVPLEQFHAAMPDPTKPYDGFTHERTSLLLMHHPVAWLEAKCRDSFSSSVLTPDRFAAFLHGHMHEGRSESTASFGGGTRHQHQARSLFGMEHYGTSKGFRAFGYTFGSLAFDGEIRLWPLDLVTKGDHERRFEWDSRYHGDQDAGFVLRPGAKIAPETQRFPIQPIDPPDATFTPYVQWARKTQGQLSVIGVGSGQFDFPMEDVYVPLRVSRGPGEGASEAEFLVEDLFADETSGSPDRILFGEPGSGKTTALRKLLHECCDGKAPGLEGFLPMFARLRRLTADDLTKSLAAFLQRELDEVSERKFDGLVEKLVARGRLLLLCDGLDEIADPKHRAAVCRYVERELESLRRTTNVRAVITCRYAGYIGEVEVSSTFERLDVRPLNDDQIERLVRAWFAYARKTLPHYEADKSARDEAGLLKALKSAEFSTQRLKVIVSTPLLLTLMCVVVAREGNMPQRRVEFYRRCLRVLLEEWSAKKEVACLLDADQALALLRPLAFHLHAAKRRDDLPDSEFESETIEQLGTGVDGYEVLEWLVRETGVMTKYAENHYGFSHLAFQEFLVAANVAETGDDHVLTLIEGCHEDWWREPFLLLFGLGDKQAITRVLTEALKPAHLPRVAERLKEALADAPATAVDLAPILQALAESTDARNEQRRALLLGLLRPWAKDGRVREAARRVAEDAAPASAARAMANLRRALLLGLLRPWAKDGRVREAARRVAEDAAPASEARAMANLLLSEAEQSFAATADLCLVRADVDAEQLDALLSRVGLGITIKCLPPGPGRSLRNQGRVYGVVRGKSGFATEDDREVRPFLAARLKAKESVQGLLLPGASKPRESAFEWIALDSNSISTQLIHLVGGSGAAAALPASRGLIPSAASAKPGQLVTLDALGLTLCGIPNGRFRFGNGHGEDGQWTRISPFWMGRTPVTNAQYARFLEATNAAEPPTWRDRRFSALQQPVVSVSFEDAEAYCKWATQVAREALGAERRIALPSEAQWEFAARSDDDRPYPWGREQPDATRACFDRDLRSGQPDPVGAYPNGVGPFGTLDQAGLVWEWCEDFYWSAAKAARSKTETTDPVELEENRELPTVHVVRGGGWSYGAGSLRSAGRGRHNAWYRGGNVGFRVCCVPASTAVVP